MTQLWVWVECNFRHDYERTRDGCVAWLARNDCNAVIVSTSTGVIADDASWHLYGQLMADVRPGIGKRIIPGLKTGSYAGWPINSLRHWLYLRGVIEHLRETGTREFLLECEGLFDFWRNHQDGTPYWSAARLRELLGASGIYRSMNRYPNDFGLGDLIVWPGVTGESASEMMARQDLCAALEASIHPTFLGSRFYRPAAVDNQTSMQQQQRLESVVDNHFDRIIQNLYFPGTHGDGWTDNQLREALTAAGNPRRAIIYPGQENFLKGATNIR